MNCQTCKWGLCTLPFMAECNKEIDDKPIHEDLMCSQELICTYWEQASDFDIKINSINWAKAPIIEVE